MQNTTPKKCLGGVATEKKSFSVWPDHNKELSYMKFKKCNMHSISYRMVQNSTVEVN